MGEGTASGTMAGGEESEARRRIREAAQRALAEASARRRDDAATGKLPREINGRKGPEPIRYGDWESKGLASDF
jgi:hypothetical protein